MKEKEEGIEEKVAKKVAKIKKVRLLIYFILLFLFVFFGDRKIVSLKKKHMEKVITYKEEKSAQERLCDNKKSEAESLFKNSLGKLGKDASAEEFSRISFLIEDGKIKKAYDKSVSFAQSLKDSGKETSSLYFYNLLRTSFLAKKLGEKQKELTAFSSLESFVANNKEVAEKFLNELEHNKQFKLLDYIDSRKKVLSQTSF